jgi:hypothetical protein
MIKQEYDDYFALITMTIVFITVIHAATMVFGNIIVAGDQVNNNITPFLTLRQKIEGQYDNFILMLLVLEYY